MVDFYEYSTPELVKLLGNRFKEYRIRCNLTQNHPQIREWYSWQYFVVNIYCVVESGRAD